MLAVDKPHEGCVNAVAEHSLDVLAALLHRLAGYRQAVVLLGAAPGRAVLRGHAKARGVASIRAAAVPKRPYEEHDGAGRHHHGRQVLQVRLDRLAISPEVTLRDHDRGAVFFGEVIDSPNRCGAKRTTRTWHRVESIIRVKGLLRLPRQDVDGLKLREQVIGLEDPVEAPEDEWMLDERIADQRLLEERVEPLRLETLEIVAAGLVLESRDEVFFDRGDELG